MYDANDQQIELLQRRLKNQGITKEQLDLGNYAGLTFRELIGIVDNAIRINNKKKESSKADFSALLDEARGEG